MQILSEYKECCKEFDLLVDKVVNNEESTPDSSSVATESSLPFVCMDYDEAHELSPTDIVATTIWEQLSRAASLRDLDAVLLLSRLLAQIVPEETK